MRAGLGIFNKQEVPEMEARVYFIIASLVLLIVGGAVIVTGLTKQKYTLALIFAAVLMAVMAVLAVITAGTGA